MSKFNQLFDSRVIYLDTYLCSEGFFAFQSVESDSLQLLTKSNVYFEFIPFNDDHFNADGELINQNSLTINEVVEGVDYALLVSTSAGAWRYLIGDTIKFTNLASLKIKITGRTKHFLNLCGEHLSIDNMTDALTKVAFDKGMDIREFAVIGAKTKSDNFKHIWFLGCDKTEINKDEIQEELDYALCQLNMDYMIERKFALSEVEIKTIPNKVFYDFMKIKDKYGAQHKFPRVLKGKLADDWVLYLQHLQLI